MTNTGLLILKLSPAFPSFESEHTSGEKHPVLTATACTMIRSVIILACILVACASATPPHCESTCAFYFCRADSNLEVDSNVEVGRTSDKVLTSPICREGYGEVGVVHSYEAYLVEDEYNSKKITKLPYNIPWNFFKTYSVPHAYGERSHSGIGHQAVHEYSQPEPPTELLQEIFDDKCWILPLKNFQWYEGDDVKSKNANDRFVDCISFSSTVPRIEGTHAYASSPVYTPTSAAQSTPATQYTPAAPVYTPSAQYTPATQYTPAAPMYTPSAQYTPNAPVYTPSAQEAPTAPVNPEAHGYEDPYKDMLDDILDDKNDEYQNTPGFGQTPVHTPAAQYPHADTAYPQDDQYAPATNAPVY